MGSPAKFDPWAALAAIRAESAEAASEPAQISLGRVAATAATAAFGPLAANAASAAAVPGRNSTPKSPAVQQVQQHPDGLPVDPDDLAERLAIQVCEAGLPEQWADGIARLLIEMFLHPPEGFTPERWQQVTRDLLRLHEAGWLPQLALLSWDALDVFGCHPRAPLARYDAAGLLLRLEGRKVLAVTAEAAVLAMPSGATLRHYRRPLAPEAVSLWGAAGRVTADLPHIHLPRTIDARNN